MAKGYEFMYPSHGDLDKAETRRLMELEIESRVASFMGTRKPDEIREAMAPERPGAVIGAMRELRDRAKFGRLWIAKKQIGGKKLPVAFASSLSAPEPAPRQYLREALQTIPLLKNTVGITPVIGPILLQKPAIELAPMHIDPELQHDDDLIQKLGERVLGRFAVGRKQISHVPYMESLDENQQTHFVPEDTLQTRVMRVLDFEIIPTAKPIEDNTTFGTMFDPLVLQPYEHKTLKSRS